MAKNLFLMGIFVSLCLICNADMSSPDISFSFEGDIGLQLLSESWMAFTSNGSESPLYAGLAESVENPNASIHGLNGQAYDTRNLLGPYCNSYVYGSFESGVDTVIEQILSNVYSFTITGWLKDVKSGSRIVRCPAFSIRYDNFEMEVQLQSIDPFYLASPDIFTTPSSASDESGNWIKSSGVSNYSTVGNWKFFAITYDGTTSGPDNIKFYCANKDVPVFLENLATSTQGQLLGDFDGSPLILGNSGPVEDGAFIGLMDEIKIWTDNADDSGVLTVGQIEEIRLQDLTIPKSCVAIQQMGMGLSSDINGDCEVDLEDFALLAYNWQMCNDPEGNCF